MKDRNQQIISPTLCMNDMHSGNLKLNAKRNELTHLESHMQNVLSSSFNNLKTVFLVQRDMFSNSCSSHTTMTIVNVMSHESAYNSFLI